MTNNTKYEPSQCGRWQAVDRRQPERYVEWRVKELRGDGLYWVKLTKNGIASVYDTMPTLSPDAMAKLTEYLSGLDAAEQFADAAEAPSTDR